MVNFARSLVPTSYQTLVLELVSHFRDHTGPALHGGGIPERVFPNSHSFLSALNSGYLRALITAVPFSNILSVIWQVSHPAFLLLLYGVLSISNS